MRFATIAALLFLLPCSAKASQIAYNAQYRGGDVEFSYEWQDSNQDLQSLKFSLPAYAVDAGSKEFTRPDENEVRKYVFENIKKYAEIKNYNVSISRSYTGYEFRSKGFIAPSRFNEQVNDIQNQISKLQEQFFENHMYTVEGNSLIPNHKAIIKRYVNAMRPVAQAMAGNMKNKNSREKVDYVLNFVQSIPYDVLDSRYSSNGAGFQTPYGLLLGNKGDCDTKSVAAAAILRNFFPNQRIIMVYVPGHAFVGFSFGNHSRYDSVLRVDGVEYVLAEPVGPALYGIGRIGDESSRLLKAGNYTYQEVPL